MPFHRVYTNIELLTPSIATGAPVVVHQPLGVSASHTVLIGTQYKTYSVIHFQLDDFRKDTGAFTNPNAVCPLDFLNPTARADFEIIWSRSYYNPQLYEPFVANPRSAKFPFIRSWHLVSGALPACIEVVCNNDFTNKLSYTLFFSVDGAVT
ncbi:MAG: hypothetical protein V1850_03835 [Candidatus Bathyarchaeota archaeon]